MKKCEFDELMDRCCTSQSMVIGHGRGSCMFVLSSVHCSCHPLKTAAAPVAPGWSLEKAPWESDKTPRSVAEGPDIVP